MARKAKNNFFSIEKIKYEDFFSENPIILELIMSNGNKIKGNCYNMQISSDKIYILSRKGNIICKNIMPMNNILLIKQYNLEDTRASIIEKTNEDTNEVNNESKGSYLLGVEGRKKAKEQFLRNLQDKDKDFVKAEEEIEETTLKIKGNELLKKVAPNGSQE